MLYRTLLIPRDTHTKCRIPVPVPVLVQVSVPILYVLLILTEVSAVSGGSAASGSGTSAATPYSSQWVVHVTDGKRTANSLAADYGFVNLGEIFEDYYHFNHRKVAKRSVHPHLEHQALLAADTRVRWAQQQKVKRRVKRDFKLQDSDPKWPSMWYLNRGDGLDMNVIPAWVEGVTGKGAVVTILDDGLEKDHPDLLQNYDPLASYDVNNGDSDPSPRYDMIDSNRHGTRCAGEVAATSNNSVCALGVAHGAHVGGVRMLDGDVTDAVEARSLSLNPQHIDIYSASWGPDDDGKTVDGPGELATRAFIEGVTKGRSGKGSIFVWASGNGGRDHDNCNCDGYTNSIYSLSISSATEHGQVPWYSEACSSTLASTYSSGAVGERQVVTTDLHHSCTSSHTGTSASAPLAAGICALALEANPLLTWRDMQHIVIRTARPQRLIAPDWATNGVGRNVSHSFGYGLMDAHAMVQLARKWVSVPEQHRCEIPAAQAAKPIPAKSMVVLQLQVNECPGIEVLEHVQAKLSIQSSRRGDLKIQLTSPMGTRVTLLDHRLQDASRSGFNHWPFMSVHSWGESPYGTWRLEIHNDGRLFAKINAWDLVLYGTTEPPVTDLKHSKIDQQTNTFTKAEDFQTNTIEEDSVDTLKSLDIMVRKDENEMDRATEASSRVPARDGDKEVADDAVSVSSNMASASASVSGCRRTSPLTSQCLECTAKYYLRDGLCQRCAAPAHFHRADVDDEGGGTNTDRCYPCHYSCAECRGPNDYDCTACYPDATLVYASYCYPTALIEDLTAETWYYRLCVIIALILSLVLVLVIVYLYRSCSRSRGHEFTKLNLQNIRDIEQSVKNTVYSDDSD